MCHSIHVAVNTWLNCSFFTLIISNGVIEKFSTECISEKMENRSMFVKVTANDKVGRFL